MARVQRAKYGLNTPPQVHLGKGYEEIIKAATNIEAGSAQKPRTEFTAYAAPMTWGPDVTVASHIGSFTYTITYEAVGDTLVMGRVSYYKGTGGGQKVYEEFKDSTTITTANAVANVVCDFKGVPTGSAVTGSVT